VFGWTWVPYESWGWAPSHYGRWGFTNALGWYWIPGATWAPAWVSWAVGGDYVGWCPLGYRDRPVLAYDRLGLARGHAVPRGTTVAETPWIYLRRGDVGARDLTRRRVQLDSTAVQQVRVVDMAQARLTRDFAVTTVPAAAVARAVPRNTSSRPQTSDTVPEMRGDPMTQIPIARRRGRPADGRDDLPAESGGVTSAPAGTIQRFGGAIAAARPPRPLRSCRPRRARPHPTDVRSGQRRAEEPAETGVISRAGAAPKSKPHAGSPGARARAVAREREGARSGARGAAPMFRGSAASAARDASRAPPRDGGTAAEDGGWARRAGAAASAAAAAKPRAAAAATRARGSAASKRARPAPPASARPRRASPIPRRARPQAQPRHGSTAAARGRRPPAPGSVAPPPSLL
jgi:hypothetical protein